MNPSKKVVTRFAPSPTGFLHVGGYRTAIFAYLHARKNGGEFILRIEDTDRERNKKEYEDNIIESLSWIGLTYDRFYRQSENLERHKEIIKQLIETGHAYVSKEEAKDGSGIIKEIVRFKNPNKVVTVKDMIKGDVSIDTTDLGDFVIARNIEDPLFHLAVIIDDWDEGVTHVIRGEEHLANTPRQILMMEAMGAPVPMYAHIPLVLGEDKLKLSKRKGAEPLTHYRDLGYLPEAMLNAVVLIGWNPGTEQEIFIKEELEKLFDLSRVQHAGAIFNIEKMNWVSKEHIKRMTPDDFKEEVMKWIPKSLPLATGFSPKILDNVMPLIHERVVKFSDVKTMFEEGEFSYFFERPHYAATQLIWKDSSKEEAIQHLEYLLEILESTSDETAEGFKSVVWPYAESAGRGNVLWPLRVSLSGREKSPDPFTLLGVFGKKESLERIKIALELLKA